MEWNWIDLKLIDVLTCNDILIISSCLQSVKTMLELWKKKTMEVFGISHVVSSANVIYLYALLGRDGPNPCHKCDWKCANENVCGNMYRCKLTGLNHVCDKNCNQRILYDNHNSLCRASGRIFPLSSAEE